jgi:hypothetical protein
MDKFLDAFNLSKLSQKDINQLNRFITRNEIEAAIKNLPIKKSPQPLDSQSNSTKPLNEINTKCS